MKVRELIELLSEMDPDANAYFPAPPQSIFMYYSVEEVEVVDNGVVIGK